MKEYLTSHKNLLTSALVALAIFTVGFAIYERNGRGGDESQSLPDKVALAPATTTAMVDRDSDADGLPDWEEHLYGSDVKEFDTDGDGTPDGKEVREGRNPAKANTAKGGASPNDMLSLLDDPHFATSATDVLGIKKEYFAKYLTEQGNQIREETYRDLLRAFDVRKVATNNQIVDLNVTSDNSVESLRAYGNAFGEIIRKYTKRAHRTESEIMTAAMAASSSEKLKELQLPAVDYKNFSNDLKVLKTPSSLASYHLVIVNGYERMSKGLILMQSMFTDPINGTGGYEAYMKGKAEVTDGYAHVVVKLIKEGVTFAPSEPGAPFTYQRNSATSTSK